MDESFRVWLNFLFFKEALLLNFRIWLEVLAISKKQNSDNHFSGLIRGFSVFKETNADCVFYGLGLGISVLKSYDRIF